MNSNQYNKSKVTVVIPCYNDGDYIDDAIQSILNQSYKDYNIIVVDDGSTDQNTINKLNNLNYPNTTVLYKKNGGVSSARNFGAKNSHSEYILFLDADDYFEKTHLAKAVDVLDNNPGIGAVTAYSRFFYERDYEKTINYYKPKGGGVKNFLLENNAGSNSLVRYKSWRDAGGFDEKLLSHEDWDFWIRVTKNGWLIYTIPEVLVNYRLTEKSKYKKFKDRKLELLKRIYENHQDIYKEYVVECLYEKEKQIHRYKEMINEVNNEIKRSPTFIIGSYITFPYRFVKKLFKT